MSSRGKMKIKLATINKQSHEQRVSYNVKCLKHDFFKIGMLKKEEEVNKE